MARHHGRTIARRELDRLADGPSRLEQADILRRVAVHRLTIAADLEEGLELGRRSHDLAANASPHQLMHTIWPILVALYNLGRWEEALQFVDEHVEAFRQDPAVECQFVRDGPVIGAMIHVERGRSKEATTLSGLVGDPSKRLDSASPWEARLAVAMGDAAAGQAIASTRAIDGRLYGPQHLIALLSALLALENWVELADVVPRARAAALGNALLEPWSDRAEGALLARDGRWRDATAMFRRANEAFGGFNIPLEVARTQTLLAPLATVDDARALLASAHATYARLGVPNAPA